MEIEIVTLQNELHLKGCKGAPNFWCFVDTEKYSGVCTAPMTVASWYGSAYLRESSFSNMNFINNKNRTHLMDTGVFFINNEHRTHLMDTGLQDSKLQCQLHTLSTH